MATVPRGLTFGAHADAYERARPEWPEEAARWLVPDGAQLVVELGAGTGKLTRAVAALGVRVVAVEPDPRMLAVLCGLGLEGVEGSAEAIPLGDGVAEAVVAGSSLHWFELELARPENHRVLRRGLRGAGAHPWAALAEPRLAGRADRDRTLPRRRACAVRARPRASTRRSGRSADLVLRRCGAAGGGASAGIRGGRERPRRRSRRERRRHAPPAVRRHRVSSYAGLTPPVRTWLSS